MKPFTFETSDPLTLGMGHPVTERIRRLSMRKTNLLTRAGTSAIILSAISLTAPVFTATAAGPVTEVVDSLAQKTVESLEDIAIAPEPKLTSDNISSKHAQLKRSSLAKAAIKTGLKPMRLRMQRDYNQKHIDEVDVARKAYVAGDKSAIIEINRLVADDARKNRFQLTIADQGEGYLDVSDGQGGWPGFPATNPAWDRRALSLDMRGALKDMISECATKVSPKYFRANLIGGDSDIGKGSYLVQCISGSKVRQESFSSLDLAKAFLSSEGLPLEERQDSFDYRMGFALMEQYVKSTPEATYQDDQKACVKIYTHLKTYDFIAQKSKGVDSLKSKCPTTNYNWVRRRHGVPEIKS